MTTEAYTSYAAGRSDRRQSRFQREWHFDGGSGVRIAVARDEAFCFYYPDNLELMEDLGAEIVFFSPLTDDTLPEDLDGLYFGGGYPELHAASLAANSSLKTSVRGSSQANMPIYAECGRFMYLCDHLTDLIGKTYPMAGCFPFGTRMLTRRKALGYREIQLAAPSPLGPAGLVGRGQAVLRHVPVHVGSVSRRHCLG